MKVPHAWLREHCDPDLAAEQLAERLAMTGTEVERVGSVGPLPEDGLEVTETVLELEVTPNRPDCLGVYGVAREVHAITEAPLGTPPWAEDAAADGDGAVEDYASVTVEAPELCPRFTVRVFTGVEVGPSPDWLRARLAAAGQRPINNVVDITNYAMLLTGQPLHAFDLDRVPGGALTIRLASDGETMTTLDGVERRFDADAVLVCDADGPSGIAGIMGGAHSEVSAGTTRVLLEVANWDGVSILRSSSKLGLRSEASTRFEKQLHPELCLRAQWVASRLIVELCGARLVPGTIDVAAELPEPHELLLRGERLRGVLGEPIDAEDAAAYLSRLGFGVERDGDDVRVQVPPDRHYDVSREADLIEEVARVHGLERLPATLPASRDRVGGLSRTQILRRRAEDALRDLGFDEVVCWSFTDAGLPDRLLLAEDDPRRAAVRIANPLSEEHAELRTTLLGGLLDAARRNRSRGAERVALFESGRVYLGKGDESEVGEGELAGRFPGHVASPAVEPHRIGCLAVGSLVPLSWRAESGPVDFFAMKGALEGLAARLGAPLAVEPVAPEPFLHPGRAGRVLAGGEPAGWIGELHPRVGASWDLEGGAAFEVDLAALAAAARSGHEQYVDVTTYPAVYEDLAVVVGEDAPAERVRAAVLESGGELLRSARVFDVYRGDQLGPGRVSLALRLEFASPERTLTDRDVAALRAEIVAALEAIGGELRG